MSAIFKLMAAPLFAEIDRLLAEHDGQTLTRAEMAVLLRPYVGSYHDGYRWERNEPWGFIDRFLKEGRLLEISEGRYLVHARALEALPDPGARLRPSGLSA